MNKSTFSLNDTAWVDFYQLQNPRPEENYTFPAIIISQEVAINIFPTEKLTHLRLLFLHRVIKFLFLTIQ